MIQNLCEIVVWHIFVNFVILISDSNETYRFTMRESNIVNMKGVFSNGKFIFKRMSAKYILTVLKLLRISTLRSQIRSSSFS